MSSEIFSSVSTSRIAQGIEKQIKGAIFSEQLKPGDRLSSEHQLSKIFNTSRTTVREALRTLEREGFLNIKQGVKGGSYIREADFSPVVNSMSHMMKLKKISLENLTEVRLVIEPEIAKMAAVRSTKLDLQRMEAALNALRQIIESKKRSTTTNIHFHRIIGESCKNPAFYLVSHSLMDLAQEHLSKFYIELENNQQLLEQHIQIYEAIKNRDPDKSYEVMKEHVQLVKKIMKNPPRYKNGGG